MTTPTSPLNWSEPIVDGQGHPTLSFQRAFNEQRRTLAAAADTTALTALTSQVETLIQQLALKVNKSGDTMTGGLLLAGDPTQATEAATKQYVDNHVSPGTLAGLTDVAVGGETDGQVLTWNAAAAKWENEAPPAGVTTLATLTDVAVAAETDGQVLTWSAADNKWKNVSLLSLSAFSVFPSVSTSETSVTSSTYSFLQCDTVTFDPAGVYDTTTHMFTAPADGEYYFYTSIRLDGVTAAGGFVAASFSKNGALNPGAGFPFDVAPDSRATSYIVLHVAGTFSLVAGDTIVPCFIWDESTGGAAYSVMNQSVFMGWRVLNGSGGSGSNAPDASAQTQMPFHPTTGISKSSGFINLQMVYLKAGTVVTGVRTMLTAASATHLSGGLVGVTANLPGTVLASSAAVVSPAAGLLDLPFTAPYTIPADGLYCFGLNNQGAAVVLGTATAAVPFFQAYAGGDAWPASFSGSWSSPQSGVAFWLY